MTTEGSTTDVDRECAICQTDLGAKAYIKVTSDLEVSETVFRLKCGHAFHNGCLCRALRNDAKCPSCRTSSDEPDSARDFQFTVGSDGNIVITIPETTQEAPEFVSGVRDIYNANAFIDRNTEVQRARADANKALRRYRAAEIEITNRRRQLISGALRRLRDECRDTFNKEKRIYLNSLRFLRSKEKEIGLKYVENNSLGDDIKNDIILMVDETTDIKTRASSDFGPLKTRFWTH